MSANPLRPALSPVAAVFPCAAAQNELERATCATTRCARLKHRATLSIRRVALQVAGACPSCPSSRTPRMSLSSGDRIAYDPPDERDGLTGFCWSHIAEEMGTITRGRLAGRIAGLTFAVAGLLAAQHQRRRHANRDHARDTQS